MNLKRPNNKRARQRIQVRHFVCTLCGTVSPATKVHGRTVPGHVKDMYCYHCRKTSPHIQRD